jgi:hypothetical protein
MTTYFTPDGEAKVGAVAEYSGVTFDVAKAKVLDLMGRGHTMDSAIEQVRKDAKDVVRKSAKPEAQKITAYRIPQAVLDVAMELADGDISRLRIDPEDGSITVVNQSRKPGS